MLLCYLIGHKMSTNRMSWFDRCMTGTAYELVHFNYCVRCMKKVE